MSGKRVATENEISRDEEVLLQYTLPTTRNLFDPESGKLVNALMPVTFTAPKDPGDLYRVAEYLPGEALGANYDILKRVPSARAKKSDFIPLDLALQYVRKVQTELKRMDRHYKSQLRTLVDRCTYLEAEAWRLSDANERLLEANEKNAKNFQTVTQMRLDFANYKADADTAIQVLKDEVKTLLKERTQLRGEVERMEGVGKDQTTSQQELDSLKAEVERLQPLQRLKALLERHETLQQQVQALFASKANVNTDLADWSAKFEEKHRRTPSLKDFSPVAHLQLQAAAFGDSLSTLVRELEVAREQLAAHGVTMPKTEELLQTVEERNALKLRLSSLKSIATELERTEIEKKALAKELDDLKRLMAVPHRTDPEVSALRSQVDYLSSELTTYKGKSFALEIENRELQEQMQNSQQFQHKSSFRSENVEPMRFELDLPNKSKRGRGRSRVV